MTVVKIENRDEAVTTRREKNALRATKAREKYHSLTVEQRKKYNQKRNDLRIRQKQKDAVTLAKPFGEANVEDLARVTEIVREKKRRADAERERYRLMTPEERRAFNHKRYLRKKERQKKNKG